MDVPQRYRSSAEVSPVVRIRPIRTTFLMRFTLLTFISAGIAAVLLALTLNTLHRHAIENDLTVAALGRIDARLTAPLSRYVSGGTIDGALRAELVAAGADAMLDPFVSALRIYDDRGRALLAAGGNREAKSIARAAASEGFISVERVGGRTIYQGYAAGERGRRFVLAVDFARAQMEAQSAREGWSIALVAAGSVALIFVALVTLASGASRELERRRREAQTTFVQTLVTLAESIDLRDPYTAGHSQRVAEYSRKLAIELRVDDDMVCHIENGALLHDIGKIGVPDAILFKKGALDPRERHLIERHPVVGAHLIERVPCAEHVTPCVLHHHERVDGSGYPHGLRGEDIPLGARIIAVSDAFDAMTTDRPYRLALSAQTAVERIVEGSGKQFDPRCVRAFAELVARGDVVPPLSTGTAVFAQRPAIELAVAI
jgi:putative nucleotidyltransferase with HDIG domain